MKRPAPPVALRRHRGGTGAAAVYMLRPAEAYKPGFYRVSVGQGHYATVLLSVKPPRGKGIARKAPEPGGCLVIEGGNQIGRALFRATLLRLVTSHYGTVRWTLSARFYKHQEIKARVAYAWRGQTLVAAVCGLGVVS